MIWHLEHLQCLRLFYFLYTNELISLAFVFSPQKSHIRIPPQRRLTNIFVQRHNIKITQQTYVFLSNVKHKWGFAFSFLRPPLFVWARLNPRSATENFAFSFLLFRSWVFFLLLRFRCVTSALWTEHGKRQSLSFNIHCKLNWFENIIKKEIYLNIFLSKMFIWGTFSAFVFLSFVLYHCHVWAKINIKYLKKKRYSSFRPIWGVALPRALCLEGKPSGRLRPCTTYAVGRCKSRWMVLISWSF